MPYKASVLLLEDNAYLCRLFERVLTHARYDVKIAKSVHYARILLRLHHFDICVCDLNLEDGSSLELFREDNPDRRIILISGDDLPDLQGVQISCFLQKPVAAKALVEAIEEMACTFSI